MKRILGERKGEGKKVLMILIGALHGNEQSGVKAIENNFRFIDEDGLKVNGKVVGLAGNLQAILQGRRYLSYDLNRCWTEEHIQRVMKKTGPQMKDEDFELIGLYEVIQELLEEGYEHNYIVDLHATSSKDGNFIVHAGIPAEESIIRTLKIPIVTNLNTYIHGTLLNYFKGPRVTSFAFEGGQIGSEKTVEVHTYGVWRLIQESGLVSQHEIGRSLHYEELILSIHHHQAELYQVLYRHHVNPKDYFRMKPGYDSFQSIAKGEMLAEDKTGKIKSPVAGKIFMPLYQNTGEDGFFIVKDV